MWFFLYFIIIQYNAIAADIIQDKVIEDQRIVALSQYISGLKSVAMDFRQSDSRGGATSGKMILNKPNKFRMNYYAPYPLLVLGNDYEVVIYDYSLEQTTRIDRKENLFNFLLSDMKEWKNNFKIEDIVEYDDNIIAKLYSYSTERTISLVLNKDPMILNKIIVDEPDGNIIEVYIDKVTQISSPEKELFSLPNPDVYGKPKRLSAKDIEKKYEEVNLQ
jgi:outer membrane lipoprotein-sorting protein